MYVYVTHTQAPPASIVFLEVGFSLSGAPSGNTCAIHLINNLRSCRVPTCAPPRRPSNKLPKGNIAYITEGGLYIHRGELRAHYRRVILYTITEGDLRTPLPEGKLVYTTAPARADVYRTIRTVHKNRREYHPNPLNPVPIHGDPLPCPLQLQRGTRVTRLSLESPPAIIHIRQ